MRGPRIVMKVGRRWQGWHLRVGSLIVAHHTPPTGAPWIERATTIMRWDIDAPLAPGLRVANIPFEGFACRRPRVAVGLERGSVALRIARALGRAAEWTHGYPAGAMPGPMSDGPRARCGPIGCGRPGCAVNHAAKLPADPFTVDL